MKHEVSINRNNNLKLELILKIQEEGLSRDLSFMSTQNCSYDIYRLVQLKNDEKGIFYVVFGNGFIYIIAVSLNFEMFVFGLKKVTIVFDKHYVH